LPAGYPYRPQRQLLFPWNGLFCDLRGSTRLRGRAVWLTAGASLKRRRRCCVCSTLYSPDPRVGDRQRTCGDAACKATIHRQSCKDYRDRERPAVEAERLQTRLGSPDLHRAVVRDAMGVKGAIVLEQVFGLIVTASRDAFASKQLDLSDESFRLVDRPRRDAKDRHGPGP
jgi:hypothetical protein